MNFPLIPLIPYLQMLAEFNAESSLVLVMILFAFAFIVFATNAQTEPYDKTVSRWGVGLLITAIILTIVGTVYIIAAIFLIISLYICGYLIIWRFFIKNIITAFKAN
jgi:hypothetical protein